MNIFMAIWTLGVCAFGVTLVLFILSQACVFSLKDPGTKERRTEARGLLLCLIAGPVAVLLWPLVLAVALGWGIVKVVKAAELRSI